MQVDHIIVGQGIAGSMVANFLLQRNKKIIVIDQHHPNAASNIAMGVVNPVTGRRMAKSWMIDEILPFAKATYRQLEQSLNTSFFFEQDIYKLFSNDDDIKIWKKKSADPEYRQYLGDIVHDVDAHINAPMGAGIIRNSCWMDVPVFIRVYRNYLRSAGLLMEEEFNSDEMKIGDQVSYKHITADSIIFCEGYRAHQNPLFAFIPFSIAKGEQFLIRSSELKTTKIINKNIFILPRGNDLYHVGSTFIWDDLEETVTENGRKEVLEKLDRMISCPYEIIDEKAGIRPTIIDRRPVIGKHPTAKNVYIFNGLGTKGVSLSPYLAHVFSLWLEGNSSIPDEASIKRFT